MDNSVSPNPGAVDGNAAAAVTDTATTAAAVTTADTAAAPTVADPASASVARPDVASALHRASHPVDHPAFDQFVATIAALRAPDGCPWDREQTHESIAHNMIEEAYEAVDAIEALASAEDAVEAAPDSGSGSSSEDPRVVASDRARAAMPDRARAVAHLREELGDLMLQVVFHARMAEEDGDFTLDDVADGICKKLILRHPHIFSDVKADTTEQVLTNWDNIKKEEKHQKSDREVLDSVSHSLPSLIRADKLAGKCKKLGYEIPTDDISSLTDEFVSKTNAADSERTLGKLLLRLSAIAKERGIDAEKALADACDDLVSTAND